LKRSVATQAIGVAEPIEATIPASSAQAIARRLRPAGRPASCALTQPRITLRGQCIPGIGCIGVGGGNRTRKATPQFS